MSSPTELAGKKPITARAASSARAIISLSMRRASAYRLLAASPTTGSVRMSGNLPANSQVLKNGIQSM